MQALILVGGLGTRLSSVINDRPKPMALVDGKPFLEYLIKKLRIDGFKEIILAVGYLGEMVEDYFGSGDKFKVKIQYSYEFSKLGTAGAVKNAASMIEETDIMILNGDTYFNINLKDFYKHHTANKNDFTIALRYSSDADRYGAVETDSNNIIIRFIEKGMNSESSYINGGIYILNKKLIYMIPEEVEYSMEKQLIPRLIGSNFIIHGYKSQDYFIDIGIPKDYFKFIEDVRNGRI